MAQSENSQDVSVAYLRNQLELSKNNGSEKKEFEKNPFALQLPRPNKSGERLEMKIRILPNPYFANNPIHEVFYNYKLGKYAPVIALKQYYGQEDPLDDYMNEIFKMANDIAKEKGIDKDREKKKADPQIKQLFQMAYALKPTPRYYCPVIVRDSENPEQVFFWGMSETVFKELKSQILEFDDDVVPFGRYSGYDVKLVVENTGQKINEGTTDIFKTSATILSMKKATPCLPDKTNEEIDEFISNIPSLEEKILKNSKKSYEEVAEIAKYLRSVNSKTLNSIMNKGVQNESVTPMTSEATVSVSNAKHMTDAEINEELDKQLGLD